MNDDQLITAVRESFTDVHTTTPVEQIVSRGRMVRARRRIPVAAAALATAIVAAVAVTSGPAPATQVITVADLANRAAAVAARQPDVRPGQWVYRKTLSKGAWDDSYHRLSADENWASADNSKSGFYFHGKLNVGRFPPLTYAIPYSSLLSLPANPRALVARLHRLGCPANRQLPGCPGYQNVFSTISTTLEIYVMPPKITAELYRALADIPGVRVEENAVDIAGRHGIGFVRALPNLGGTQEIIINSRTYKYMGSYFAYFGEPARNTVGQALVRQAFVSGPGVRP